MNTASTMETYAAINARYPSPVPACSRIEARRAARRLMKHFAQRDSRWLRPIWVTAQPTTNFNRGWTRLIHDVSHRIFYLQNRSVARSHGGWHADLEQQIAEYVLAKGWLSGSLKPPTKTTPTLDEKRSKRLAHAQAMLTAWERRSKIATGRVRRWRGRVRDAQRLALKIGA